MTLQEFSNEFDILYSNISNGLAPGVNEYEKSIFLTRGLEELIQELYTNGFDANELVRLYINSLVKYCSIINSTESNPLGKHFSLEEIKDMLFPVSMSLYFKESNKKPIPVYPITYDEYNITKENPFKYNKKRALGITASDKIIILYDDKEDYKLIIHYLSKPTPIILTTLDGVTINGKSTKSETNIPDIIHFEIIKKAVELALTANKVTE